MLLSCWGAEASCCGACISMFAGPWMADDAAWGALDAIDVNCCRTLPMFSGLSCWPASLAAFWASLVGPSGTLLATDSGLVAALPASSLLAIRSPALSAAPLVWANPWVANPAAVAAMLPASPTPGIRVIGEGGV